MSPMLPNELDIKHMFETLRYLTQEQIEVLLKNIPYINRSHVTHIKIYEPEIPKIYPNLTHVCFKSKTEIPNYREIVYKLFESNSNIENIVFVVESDREVIEEELHPSN